jgi:hypothetical protein
MMPMKSVKRMESRDSLLSSTEIQLALRITKEDVILTPSKTLPKKTSSPHALLLILTYAMVKKRQKLKLTLL